jgi:hypothetical protein
MIALLACVAACEPPTEPIAPGRAYLLIHAVLDAGAPHQEIRVERVASGFNQNVTVVSGAEVTVITPDGLHFLAREYFYPRTSTTAGYLLTQLGTNAIPLVPGGRYTLHVLTPAGEEASGTTIVPLAPAFELPVILPEFRRAQDTLRLQWPRVAGAAGYEVDIKNAPIGSQGFFTDYSVFTDTSITIAGNARTIENEQVFRPGYSAFVSVVAVDANYYTYYHPVVDPFAGAPPSRLTGAIGVFGSVAPLRLVTYLEVR